MTELVFSEEARVPLPTWDSLDIPQATDGNYYVWDQYGAKYKATSTPNIMRFTELHDGQDPLDFSLGAIIDDGTILYTQPPARKQTRVGDTLKTTKDFQTAPIGTVIHAGKTESNEQDKTADTLEKRLKRTSDALLTAARAIGWAHIPSGMPEVAKQWQSLQRHINSAQNACSSMTFQLMKEGEK